MTLCYCRFSSRYRTICSALVSRLFLSYTDTMLDPDHVVPTALIVLKGMTWTPKSPFNGNWISIDSCVSSQHGLGCPKPSTLNWTKISTLHACPVPAGMIQRKEDTLPERLATLELNEPFASLHKRKPQHSFIEWARFQRSLYICWPGNLDRNQTFCCCTFSVVLGNQTRGPYSSDAAL